MRELDNSEDVHMEHISVAFQYKKLDCDLLK